jgi:hypothetical protein
MKLTKLATEEDRRTKIIEYIDNHHGCNLEDIVRGTENYVSRMTVRRILDSLEKVDAIRRQKDKPNSRDHKFFVDSTNPLISLPKEFDKFKKYYYSLLETVKKEVKEYLSYSERNGYITDQYFGHLANLGLIFGEFIRIYNTRALLVWPKQIKDTESLRKLYMLLFSQVLEILGEISKVLQFLFSDLGAITEEGIFGNIGVGLLGQGLVQSALYNIGEHNDIEADTNRVIEHISEIWEKDYKSYVLKVENLETKMDELTGNYVSRDRKRKQKIMKI